MQVFKANIYLMGLIILAAACAGRETAVSPTPIIPDDNVVLAAPTPT